MLSWKERRNAFRLSPVLTDRLSCEVWGCSKAKRLYTICSLRLQDAHRSALKQFEPKKKNNHICCHPKEFLSKEVLLRISCQWVHHQPPSSIPSSYLQKGHSHRCWDRGLKACGHVPTALRLLWSPKQFTRILQKRWRKSCNQATGSNTPSAMHCQKQMGMLIYSFRDWIQVCIQTLWCRCLQSSSRYSSWNLTK